MHCTVVAQTQTLLNRRFCIDALSYAGTAEAAQVLLEMFLQQKLSKADDLKRVFLGLASAERPAAAHITVAWVSD